jgi:formylglycine-generating enzyme required for sulfatase activity
LNETIVRPLSTQEDRLVVRDALGERHFAAENFPLPIGGAGNPGPGNLIVLAGRPAATEAWLGVHEDQMFVQPAEGAEVLHNGARVQRSTWLKPGDVVNLGQARLRFTQHEDQRILEVDDGSSGNITAPPVIVASARVHGESDSAAEPIAAIPFRAGQGRTQRRRWLFNPARLVLALVALVVAAALWFIFTAISVSVVVNPATAKVNVDGVLPAVPLGNRFLLRPGAYRVHAAQVGYTPAELKINVTAGPNQQFVLTLAKLPGRLRIEAPATAQVTIDGKERGAAPGEFELTPGRHTLGIAAARYQPFTADVDVEGAGKSQTFTPALVPAWADVTVTSEPPGAQLLVNSEPRGTTPLTTQILSGSHPVELRLEGFKPWTTDVQVKANEPMTLGPVRLGLPDGRLAVRSEPAGASVSVGGVYRGQTPLDIELRPDVPQSIMLTKAGYESTTRAVTMAPGERKNLSVPLSGVFGEITLRAQPADAQVFIDGQVLDGQVLDGKTGGNGSRTLRLVAASHEIQVRKPGFVDFKTTVTPRPGLPQVIEATLLTAEQTRVASIPAQVTSKADQQLRLMPLGKFTMGSPRREPGRRPNEAQHDVEFKRSFYIGVKEVTNAGFRRFRPDHHSGIAGPNTLDLENQPVVGVNWNVAAAYCNWLSEQEGLPPAYKKEGDTFIAVKPMTTGYRLPTDAEWEWAARYAGGGKFRRYPWGDTLPVAPASGNYADASARIVLQDIVPDYDDGFVATAPVAKFPPNTLGLYDIGGNVAEWAHDYYTVSSDAAQVAVDPLGPELGKSHVIRGSSWRQSSVTDLRLSARDFGDGARNDVGFRIARYVE